MVQSFSSAACLKCVKSFLIHIFLNRNREATTEKKVSSNIHIHFTMKGVSRTGYNDSFCKMLNVYFVCLHLHVYRFIGVICLVLCLVNTCTCFRISMCIYIVVCTDSPVALKMCIYAFRRRSCRFLCLMGYGVEHY